MNWKRHLPTVFAAIERRRQAKRNRLPRHLRPPSRRPLAVQLTLNGAILGALLALVWNKEEFMSEASPAIGLVVTLLFLIYALISAFKLRARFTKIKGHRLARINFAAMILALLGWAATLVAFLP